MKRNILAAFLWALLANGASASPVASSASPVAASASPVAEGASAIYAGSSSAETIGEATGQYNVEKGEFADLKPVKGFLRYNGTDKKLSPVLTGVFLEDINYAIDGGLYGELIQNRDFEYDPSESDVKGWGPSYAWSVSGDKIDFSIATDDPIHPDNPHYARLNVKGGIATLVNNGGNAFVNSGYDGISVEKAEPYRLKFKARCDKKMPLEVALVSEATGKKLATAKLTVSSSRDWKDYEVMLTPNEHQGKATLHIVPKNNGTLDLDMVSLFPVNTFHGRENGQRRDLAETLAALKPEFVRFPGVRVANGIDNIYDWKESIGTLEERKPFANPNGYHQTRGMGFQEYFQFCEDIGAEPLPVVPLPKNGEIQDILDLISFANGESSSEWGAKRVEGGHAAPFNLKYIAIGDKDMSGEAFRKGFAQAKEVVEKAHPEITIVVASTHWNAFGKSAVEGKGDIATALADAIYYLTLEQNCTEGGESSTMPLLGKVNHSQRVPALINFTNGDVTPTANYHALRLFGENSGGTGLGSDLQVESSDERAKSHISASMVKDESTGDIMVKMVNFLPVATEMNVDVTECFPEGTRGIQAVGNSMTGRIGDEKASLKTERISVASPHFAIPLAPYSFTVLRLKK